MNLPEQYGIIPTHPEYNIIVLPERWFSYKRIRSNSNSSANFAGKVPIRNIFYRQTIKTTPKIIQNIKVCQYCLPATLIPFFFRVVPLVPDSWLPNMESCLSLLRFPIMPGITPAHKGNIDRSNPRMGG